MAQTKAARAESKAAGDVASTAAAKDRELDRLQAQLDGALRKYAAAVGAKEGAELKAKRAETQRKQAERRTASSEKAKAKSRSTATGRQDVYCMMGCLGNYIDGLGNLEQGAPAPDVQKLGLAVAAALPHLKTGVYDPWWASVEENLEETYQLATAEETWIMASAHLQAASVPMRKTHDHNMSKDCTDIEELRHACVTTDHVESGFGAVDYFNFHTSSSMRASIGVAHSNRLHLFQSPGEKLAKARKVIMTERRIGGKGTKEDAEALVSKWEFTSFRSLPREERRELLTDLQRRSKELRGVYRAKMKEHDSARLKRKRDSRDNEITAANNKYLKYEQYNKITAITSTAGLDALTAKYKGKGKENEYSEHLRDQLRVRQHCYNI